MDLSSSEVGQFVADLSEQVKRLESKIIHMESDGKTNFTVGFPDADDGSSGLHLDDFDQPLHLAYRPEIRKCNFADFKNRFCEDDARAAVDVLVSGDLLQQEYLEELRLRERLSEPGGVDVRAAKRKAEALVKETTRNNSALQSDQSERTWNQRIRIQAPALLDFLARVQKEPWSNKPRTYWRPFTTLIYYHPEVKKALSELEDRWAERSKNQHLSTTNNNTYVGGSTPEAAHGVLDDTKATLDILRAYVRFIDEEVIPDSHQYEALDVSSSASIRFSDLCYLFKPGDLIYRPSEREKLGERGTGDDDANMGERVWRVILTNDALKSFRMQTMDHEKQMFQDLNEGDEDDFSFSVDAYHVDYVGDEFCVVPQAFRIPAFQGQKLIGSLPFFPVRFIPDHEKFLDECEALGDSVIQSIETKHAFYDGWTVMRTPQDGFITDANGNTLKHREYINSEVMVDFQEAFQSFPAWQPQRTVLRPEFINKVQIYDDFPIRWQSGRDRAKIVRETREILPYRTGIQYLRRNAFMQQDTFLAAITSNAQRGIRTTKEWLRREEKVLIHCRVFAYIFRERRFAQLDVSKLKSSRRNFDALEALKIPMETKRIIQGSVRGHFLQKKGASHRGDDGLSQDIIQGKGAGLFILLHGPPGVGKTMTAEAVAQANGKPLFKITCGDIGSKPEQVESALRGIFRLANTWDCILLMDEVDTFFAQRSKGDSATSKNALVTVFLSVLEHYPGILFMTTNRVGALDEAFKSRIHYKIYYPPLSKDQTIEIWRLNIKRLVQINQQAIHCRPLDIQEHMIMEFAEWQYDAAVERGHGQWSGRQIRNAFQVARSLAHYDAMARSEDTDGMGYDGARPPAVVTVDYFRMMDSVTEDFDRYMQTVRSNQRDQDLALEMENRNDRYQGDRSARAKRMQHEVEDPFARLNGVRSPLDLDFVRDNADGERRPGYRSNRQSLTGLGAQQRPSSDTLAPPSSRTYEELPLGGSNSPLQRPRGFDSHGSPIDDVEYIGQHNPFAPRPGAAFGLGGGRISGTSAADYSVSREMRPLGPHETEQYLNERNVYGKRERRM